MRYHQLGFGLHLCSELAVPGAQPAQEGAAAVEVVLGGVPAGTGRGLGPYRLADDGLVFAAEDVARYLCARDGRRIVVEARPGELVAAAHLLAATALPALLWLRGGLVLHAAAACLPGRSHAVAILGSRGSGKSTCLRALLAAGAEAVADDALHLHPSGHAAETGDTGFMVSGLPACTLLRTETPQRLEIPVPCTQQRATAGLGAVLVLDPAAPPAVRRLHGAEALAALHRNLHRPLVPELLGLLPATLARLASVVAAVPVFAGGREIPSAALFALAGEAD